ncbi:MAG: 50S ribosomal protein L24 [Miniphocaeibacter sp.]|uniref:50S ribosomal protein L24 n=1 Tax=Miniphocaeibacter sp. TaxID=3100973 RepID=UPI0017D3E7FF|nr:50S ribosomal protein L24 [Gallicola sp.]
MKIKKDDTVIVVAGKDKGKQGKVLRTLPKVNKVIVEGVNIQTKHEKPRGPEQPGGIQKSEGPIDASNVMYYDSKAGKGSRIGYKVENGTKVRISKASGQEIK